ncbi:MAG: FtsX-like permease family protein [Halocynthiibacter sp.]
MTGLLTKLLGRLPIGWLQLIHNKGRLAAAVAGVAFANLLVFVQLGILGAMNGSIVAAYDLFDADIMLSAADSDTLTSGSNIPRARMFEALGVPGVSNGTPLYIGNMEWVTDEGDTIMFQSFALDLAADTFTISEVGAQLENLQIEDSMLIDTFARGLPEGALKTVSPQTPFVFEASGRTLRAMGTLSMGGSFAADGTAFVSDQTFMRLFGQRSAGAPNHILLKVNDGVSVETVIARLKEVLPTEEVQIRTYQQAKADDLSYQTTEKPTGIIFGFGVLIGVLVGIVIVYQILSTDVADHLKEYATFKAMGFGQGFFTGIVFEEAIVLAIFGFIPGLLASMAFYAALAAATGLPMVMDSSRALSVFAGTVVACAISGTIATRRLAGADPADLF